jgi:hypothetical protein
MTVRSGCINISIKAIISHLTVRSNNFVESEKEIHGIKGLIKLKSFYREKM